LDDIGQSGMGLIKEIVAIYKNYSFKTEILAASIRSTVHVQAAAMAGAHVATVPFKILEQMYHHDLTDKGIKLFLDDWQKVTK
jgi:transaldolase